MSNGLSSSWEDKMVNHKERSLEPLLCGVEMLRVIGFPRSSLPLNAAWRAPNCPCSRREECQGSREALVEWIRAILT